MAKTVLLKYPVILHKSKATIKAITLPVLLLLLCEWLVDHQVIASYLLPAPSSLWQSFMDLAQADLINHIKASSLRVAYGFVLGGSLGLLCAIWVGLSRQARDFLDPSLSAIKAIPSLAWIPLLLLWLGIDESSKITLIAIGAFFPVYTNSLAAIEGVDHKLLELGVSYQLSGLQQIMQIILPAASPGILTGLRNSLSLSWMFMIAAELIAATQGIGYLLSDGRETSRPDIVILAVLGKVSDQVMRGIERWYLRWRDTKVN